MKRLIFALLIFPSLSFATPFDFILQQRNIADTATLTRTVPLKQANLTNIFATDVNTNLPMMVTLGQPFGVFDGQLEVSIRWDQVLNAPVLSPVATSGNYNDLSNKPSFSQVNSDWSAVSGPEQILNKPSLFSGSYADLTGKPSLFSGVYADLSGKPSLFSGNYADLSGKPTITSGTVTSVTAGTGLSGGAITTSGTISMPNTGTAGSYTSVTTDAQGRVTSGLTASINDSPGRSLVTTTASTGFQVSSTRVAQVCYEGSFSTTSSIGGPSSASVFLETADTNSTTAGDWTTISKQTYSNNITLAIVLNQVQGNNWSMCRYIPAGKFVRIRSGSISGTASVSINAEQQEVLQ